MLGVSPTSMVDLTLQEGHNVLIMQFNTGRLLKEIGNCMQCEARSEMQH